MSKVKLKVMGHLDENLADNDITQGQGALKSFPYNNKKNPTKKSIYANKKNNKKNKTKISKSKFTVGGPEDQRQKKSVDIVPAFPCPQYPRL